MKIRDIRIHAILLQTAMIWLVWSALPGCAQTNDSTANSTTTTTQSTTDPILQGTEFQKKPDNNYAGMGKDINLRKDAWSWYWNEKAHLDIDTEDKNGFWGNDGISLFFKGIADNFVVPFWNGAMEYDFIRGGLLLVIAGMLLGFGASIVLPKKPENK